MVIRVHGIVKMKYFLWNNFRAGVYRVLKHFWSGIIFEDACLGGVSGGSRYKRQKHTKIQSRNRKKTSNIFFVLNKAEEKVLLTFVGSNTLKDDDRQAAQILLQKRRQTPIKK